MSSYARRACAGALVLVLSAGCQSPAPMESSPRPSVVLRAAPLIQFRGANSSDAKKPGDCDCNSPAHWQGGTLYVFNSAGHPWRCSGSDLIHLDQDYRSCEYDNKANGGRWIECTWKADDGTLYGWYHLEPQGICPGAHPKSPQMSFTAPKIGAVKSSDDGATWHDLGIVLEAEPGFRCDTKNLYFVGGNGDFSVMLNARKELLYFFISTYTGEAAKQGVAVARMPWNARDHPVGKVWKWHAGRWTEPGLGGQVSPIFPARIDWHRADADAFWGPSVHWNSYLRQYVILLNRTKDASWTQEGIYITFNPDLSNPDRWSPPRKILDGPGANQWYPQVIGIEKTKQHTDKLAGQVARLFVRGQSRWEIVFLNPGKPR
jgi:hypothetical protein